MATTIRPEISSTNQYHIKKHRYYELTHFCLQYYDWQGDWRGYRTLVRETCYQADPVVGKYIFKAVTEGVSYTYLKTKMDIPCGRSMYFDRYRKFFWLLSEAR